MTTETTSTTTTTAATSVKMKDSDINREPETGPPGLWQTRYFQALLLFFGFTLAYTMRICISVAIVAMTDQDNKNSSFPVYDWNNEESGYVKSSFFWGYTVTQIPAGYIAKHWSAKHLLTIGMFSCALFSLLTRVAADVGWGLVCGCRVVMGLSQSALLPCMHTLLSKWVPPHERARIGSLTYSGAHFGTVVSNVISGALGESSAGWPSVFYFFGGVSLIWTIVFFFYGADSPSTSKRISEEEKYYIESCLNTTEKSKADGKLELKTPWKAIFTSVPVWALIVAHSGHNWGFWFLATEISTYMDSILHFNLSENGFKAALPYLTLLLLAFPVSWLSDFALKKGVRLTVLRKVANTLSQWGPALALIGLCFTKSGDTTLPVIILVIAVGTNVGSLCGFQINHIDLSPNYAGIVMSITNCFASVVAIIAPIVSGAVVSDKTDFSQWQIVFYLTAGIYFVGNAVFLIYGSAERQWWDDPRAVDPKKSNRVL